MLADRLSSPSGSEKCLIEPVRPLQRRAATEALRRRFAQLRPDLEASPAGYVSRIEDNLLAGVESRHFTEDFDNGDGRELDGKFRAVHSSAALAVNAFARFKDGPAHLSLAGRSGFETIAFEFRCPTGLRGTPPHLDLLAQGPAGVVAVESKCTEHLERKVPSFSPRYAGQIRDERRAGVWFRAMETIRAKPAEFGFLDVAQLIKHALGLARCFRERPTTLLYLYWEPPYAERHPIFRQHRCAIERFSDLVAGGFPAFRTQSYPELWHVWHEAAEPKWLREHAANLHARYAVPLGGG